ncbi:HAD family hydrolase [Rhizohabitans arisaemae]|uniref:HAD family hydrolase n=1 Tax=Rhizohabitans arisaemae TaxID=2720610 RepID=UPI0024B057D3|nr:HAD family phosphatase [Rhizohabitans arisaemae]
MLFDLDGTLINSERRSMAMWAMLLRAHDVRHDDAILRGFMGRRGRDVLPEFFPGGDIEALFDEVVSYGEHPDLPEVELVPGASSFVRQVVGHGSPVALVTSATRWWAESALAQLDVAHLISTRITAEDVTEGKPHPGPFLLAAAALGVDPVECVVFEDSAAGIAAARAAGMSCVGVATTLDGGQLGDADLVVADLTEIEWPAGLDRILR